MQQRKMEMGEPPKLRKLSSTKIVKTKNVVLDNIEDHGRMMWKKWNFWNIYILNCFLEKGSNSTFLAFFPNKEISKEPEEGEQEITKKMLTLYFENIHVLLSSNSSLPIYYNIFSILVHCADAEIIQPVVEEDEDEENDEELEFEIWRKPQLPKMATVAIVSEMEKNLPNNTLMGITPDSSSESSWSMKLWKSNLKWKRKRKKCNMKWLNE